MKMTLLTRKILINEIQISDIHGTIALTAKYGLIQYLRLYRRIKNMYFRTVQKNFLTSVLENKKTLPIFHKTLPQKLWQIYIKAEKIIQCY